MYRTSEIRETREEEIPRLLDIHRKAFGPEEGPVIAELVTKLFADETARPILSLAADYQGELIGHILYTKASVRAAQIDPQKTEEKHERADASAEVYLLAPLAVLPSCQSKGIGGRLIRESLFSLHGAGAELVFVLGHPTYYPRFGFLPAGVRGFEAPYPIAAKNADAWMVQELNSGLIGRISGKVECCNVFKDPQYWQE